MCLIKHIQYNTKAEDENCSCYKERVESYFLANDIDDKKKQKSIFITAIGARTYKLLRDLLMPIKSMEASIEGIFDILKMHLYNV